jgi:arabinose-5-phosphate isomerase
MIEPTTCSSRISNSGESRRAAAIVPPVKRRARSSSRSPAADSPLAREADVHLDAGVAKEACPLNLAPTASTTAALALGDALAVALLDARGFTPPTSRARIPAARSAQALLHVADVMRRGDDLPTVPESATLAQAVDEMSRGRSA